MDDHQTVLIANYPGNEKLPLSFWRKLAAVCLGLQIDPSGAAAIMYHESGFNPQAVNPHDGGSGLLQFTGNTKPAVGWSPEEIRQMTGEQQLAPMAKFWSRAQGRLHNAGDFFVWNMGHDPSSPDSTVLVPEGETWGGLPALHSALDHDGDGAITLGDIRAEADKTVGASAGRPPLAVEPDWSVFEDLPSGPNGPLYPPGSDSHPKGAGSGMGLAIAVVGGSVLAWYLMRR